MHEDANGMGNQLKIKICGMRDPENIREVAGLKPDYMGFIYYPGSGRFAGSLSPADIADLPEEIQKVGVFVNSPLKEVLSISGHMGFHTVQLHGSEHPGYCKSLKESGLEIIKAVGVGQGKGFEGLAAYRDCCAMFLLDTAGPGFGGTGRKFGWDVLKSYDLDVPFFLSGGIGLPDAGSILKLDHPGLFGVDLNSRFETEPGVKNRQDLSEFILKIRSK